MSININIITPPPHSDIQKIIMNFFLLNRKYGLQELWVAIGTKGGKSIGASAAIVNAAPLRQQSLFRWIAPYWSQSKIGYKYMQRMLPKKPIVLPNKSELALSIPSIDTTIQCFHGQDPEALE